MVGLSYRKPTYRKNLRPLEYLENALGGEQALSKVNIIVKCGICTNLRLRAGNISPNLHQIFFAYSQLYSLCKSTWFAHFGPYMNKKTFGDLSFPKHFAHILLVAILFGGTSPFLNPQKQAFFQDHSVYFRENTLLIQLKSNKCALDVNQSVINLLFGSGMSNLLGRRTNSKVVENLASQSDLVIQAVCQQKSALRSS